MAIKTHLKCSDEPLKEGHNYFSICGDAIPQAAFVSEFIADSGDIVALRDSLKLMIGLCSRCKKERLNGRYVYCLRSGEERKQQENEI